MASINRVHGGLLSPKNFAGPALQDFTLTFWGPDGLKLWADYAGTVGAVGGGNGGAFTGGGVYSATTGTAAGGVFDQVFRSAVTQFGSLSRVGTLNTTNAAYTINFALEALGVDPFSPSGLGLGSVEGTTASTVAAALTAAVQGLGTVNGVTLNTASVSVTALTY